MRDQLAFDYTLIVLLDDNLGVEDSLEERKARVISWKRGLENIRF